MCFFINAGLKDCAHFVRQRKQGQLREKDELCLRRLNKLSMPIFQGKRQDKDHAADVSRTYEANDRLTLLMREHQAQQYQLISQYNAAKAIYDRQQSEVLPLLRKKVSLVNAQYRGGSSALPELLAARRDLLSGEIASNNAEKALADAWAAIRYLIPQDVK